MRVLAVDPGFGRCGIAIVDNESGKPNVVYSSCIETPSGLAFNERLASVGGEIARLIDEFGPDTLALEELFFSNNQKTALQVAEVRGMLLYLGKTRGLGLVEYNPSRIKIAMTGHGRATKNEVIRMVDLLTRLPSAPRLDDEYDAIALGMTAVAESRNTALRKGE
jgi:crossover junction endodeoxyribonuclease RuvC